MPARSRSGKDRHCHRGLRVGRQRGFFARTAVHIRRSFDGDAHRSSLTRDSNMSPSVPKNQRLVVSRVVPTHDHDSRSETDEDGFSVPRNPSLPRHVPQCLPTTTRVLLDQ